MVSKLNSDTTEKIKTIIHVRGFDRDFEAEVYRKEPITMEYAEWWAESQIITTAMVIGITHFLKEGQLYIRNEKYKIPKLTTFKTKTNGTKEEEKREVQNQGQQD